MRTRWQERIRTQILSHANMPSAHTLLETGPAMGGSVIPEKNHYAQNFPSDSCEIPKFGKTRYTLYPEKA